MTILETHYCEADQSLDSDYVMGSIHNGKLMVLQPRIMHRWDMGFLARLIQSATFMKRLSVEWRCPGFQLRSVRRSDTTYGFVTNLPVIQTERGVGVMFFTAAFHNRSMKWDLSYSMLEMAHYLEEN